MKAQDILNEGTVFVAKDQTHDNQRRYIYYNGRVYIYAVVLWNATYPDDMLKVGEVIHHKDLDRLNDAVSNYQKLTRSAHMRFHAGGEMNPFYGKRHSEETKTKMRKKAVGRIPPSRKGIQALTWDYVEALELRNKGCTWKFLADKYGVTPEAIAQAFKRRKHGSTKS